MIDLNDNAKAAVRAFADYIGQSDKCERYLEVFETKKTVADAYAWAGGRWKYDGLDVIVFDDKFLYSTEEYTSRKVICTRAEFEAYVKEQEDKQEGEKWTHTLDGRKCKIIINKPDVDEDIVVLCKEGDYQIVGHEALKTIKPTISDKQVASIIEAAAAWGVDPDDCQDYLSKFTLKGGKGECNF